MNESSDEPPLQERPHSWARTTLAFSKLNPFRAGKPDSISESPHQDSTRPQHVHNNGHDGSRVVSPAEEKQHGEDTLQENRPAVDKKGNGEESAAIGTTEPKLPLGQRFFTDVRHIAFSSWINILLVFVPVGITLGILDKVNPDHPAVSPSVVFAVNAIAIIPLASMLTFATENVAIKCGDTIGALLNVTFGNAVELIIFIIALVANEIRIVQAALLGSILANLLLILGMCFVFGGLRFREQLYNSTVSQMSACLLSLSVISLLLPTAFHASFSDVQKADKIVVKVSRGTSVILLIVYVLYLLFQLKSHAYMYESTPQHLIDEESHPGILADMLNSSSSSSESSSSSDSDSDSSSSSHTTAKRIKRLVRRKRRKSNASSKVSPSPPSFARTPSSTTNNNSFLVLPRTESPTEIPEQSGKAHDGIFSGDEADTDGEPLQYHPGSQTTGIISQDFETSKTEDSHKHSPKDRLKKKAKKMKKIKYSKKKQRHETVGTDPKSGETNAERRLSTARTPQVEFATETSEIPDSVAAKRPFNMRHISSAVRPALPKGLASTVFVHHEAVGRSMPMPTLRPSPSRASTAAGVRRAASLPDIHRSTSNSRPWPVSAQPLPHLMPSQSQMPIDPDDIVDEKKHLSQTSSIILLVFSTALVAVCAEFLVDSIDYLIDNSGVSQAFVGLIIVPIVGNAAEHVTAVTVASKNKMDLAINVALGSSIQIALFVTPFIVLLGWMIGRDMSLYFSLFETISLFASAFIVNYLMIDGRSNYLEGALLIAAYVIIAVAAFFYPKCGINAASGPTDSLGSC